MHKCLDKQFNRINKLFVAPRVSDLLSQLLVDITSRLELLTDQSVFK